MSVSATRPVMFVSASRSVAMASVFASRSPLSPLFAVGSVVSVLATRSAISATRPAFSVFSAVRSMVPLLAGRSVAAMSPVVRGEFPVSQWSGNWNVFTKMAQAVGVSHSVDNMQGNYM